jgi:8-oxo-dGTP pyrophosphatase MutT (NUDIX family)
MGIDLRKYWNDIIAPVLRFEQAPTIPQAVVLQEQHVLLVKRDNPMLWELPGGGLLPGETPEDAIVREVYEETGIRIKIVSLLGWYSRTGFRAHLSPIYICHPISGEPILHSEDVIQVHYFPLHSLPRGQFPWYRPILQHDLLSSELRPLRRTQHLGIGTVLHCILLDLACRLRLLP